METSATMSGSKLHPLPDVNKDTITANSEGASGLLPTSKGTHTVTVIPQDNEAAQKLLEEMNAQKKAEDETPLDQSSDSEAEETENSDSVREEMPPLVDDDVPAKEESSPTVANKEEQTIKITQKRQVEEEEDEEYEPVSNSTTQLPIAMVIDDNTASTKFTQNERKTTTTNKPQIDEGEDEDYDHDDDASTVETEHTGQHRVITPTTPRESWVAWTGKRLSSAWKNESLWKYGLASLITILAFTIIGGALIKSGHLKPEFNGTLIPKDAGTWMVTIAGISLAIVLCWKGMRAWQNSKDNNVSRPEDPLGDDFDNDLFNNEINDGSEEGTSSDAGRESEPTTYPVKRNAVPNRKGKEIVSRWANHPSKEEAAAGT